MSKSDPQMDLVDRTLQEWRRSPHQYGVSDCVLSAAAFWGAEPEWAGTYWNASEAMDLMADLGGMYAVMESIGGRLVDGPPQRGDFVGLVGEEGYPIPTLCTGDTAVARLERGTIEIPLRLLSWVCVWRGPDRKALQEGGE